MAKFTAKGIMPEFVGKLTLYQALSALYEMQADTIFRMRLAGAKIEFEEEFDPATAPPPGAQTIVF